MSTAQTNKISGGCLCGGVRYEVHGKMRPVSFCHCEQCRKTSGHYVAATACANENLKLLAETSLRWFQSSSYASRGFCSTCGASIFWRLKDGDSTSIMAGTVDVPTGLRAVEHIFVADASDYHEIDDGLPQHQQYDPDHTIA